MYLVSSFMSLNVLAKIGYSDVAPVLTVLFMFVKVYFGSKMASTFDANLYDMYVLPMLGDFFMVQPVLFVLYTCMSIARQIGQNGSYFIYV